LGDVLRDFLAFFVYLQKCESKILCMEEPWTIKEQKMMDVGGHPRFTASNARTPCGAHSRHNVTYPA